MKTRSAQPLIRLENTTILQHGIPSLKDVSWSIYPGQQWAVLGANGSGKSALAAALCGLAFTAAGEITYSRTVENAVACVSFQLQRAFVAQEDCFFQSRWYREEDGGKPTLTARCILAGAGDVSADALERNSAVRMLGLQNILDREALHLSTGEMRRTLIARALLKKPKVLLLDEPFIGLDIAARETFADALDTLMKRGLSVIVFTTRPDILPKRVSQLLFLRDAKVSGQCPRRCPTVGRERAKAFGRSAAGGTVPKPIYPLKKALRAPIVELRNVSVRAPGKKILDGIDWTVQAGERWALTGHNGAGKTTLLSLILGDHPQAFAEDVNLFGKARGELSLKELKDRVGWASPDILLHYSGDTTVLELVCSGYASTMGLYERCSKKQYAHARAWLNYFALNKHEEKPFRFLSEGQQRMVLLARALVKNPPLLILDEPCQGLDLKNRARVIRALDAVCKKNGTTLLYVSHYAEERPHCIDHVLELAGGRVVK